MAGDALMRTAAIPHQTIARVDASMAVPCETCARQTGARTPVTTERIRAGILAQAVPIAKHALVDIFA